MRYIFVGVCCACSTMGSASAAPQALDPDGLLNFCNSRTIAEAAEKGDRLGWQQADDKEWRRAFLAHNGGSVEVLSWRRGEKDSDGIIAFWVARGPNNFTACAYSVGDAIGFLQALSNRFGTPSSSNKFENGTVQSWTSGALEVSYAQIGSSVSVQFTHKD